MLPFIALQALQSDIGYYLRKFSFYVTKRRINLTLLGTNFINDTFGLTALKKTDNKLREKRDFAREF